MLTMTLEHSSAWWESLGWFALAGVGACLLVAGTDGTHLQWDGRVFGALAGLAVASGIWIGLGLAWWRAVTLWVLPALHRRLWMGLVVATAVSPFAWLLAEGALTGHKAALVISPSWSVPMAAVLVSSATGFAVALSSWLLERRRLGRMDRATVLLGVVPIAVAGGVALQWENGILYVRLYPVIHTAMTWSAVGLLVFAFLLAIGRRAGRRTSVVGLVAGSVLLAFLALGIGWLSLRPLQRSNLVRAQVMGRSQFASDVLRIGVRSRARTPFVSGVGHAGHEAQHGLLDRAGASVVLVTVDALRFDRLGAYGSTFGLTPQLDRRTQSAVRFEKAYCHAPHSSYSLSSLLTGMPMRSLVALHRPLPMTLAELLGQAGYETAGFCTDGIFFTEGEKLDAYRRKRFGFAWFDAHGYDGAELTRRAKVKLEELAVDQRPFFLWVHYFDVHAPYRSHSGLTKGNRPVDRYDGEVAYVDRYLPGFLDAVAATNRKVIVILTADHGEEFGEHGGHYHGSSLYREQVRVPLFLWIPSLGHRVVSAPASLMDVTPTVLDLVRLPEPEDMEGETLIPWILGRHQAERPIFSEVATKRMVVLGRYKLIYDSWRDIAELYDLDRDPAERKNLADARPALRRRLRALLSEQLARLGGERADVPQALALARLGDRSCRKGLCDLVLDRRAKVAHRVEAARRLAKMPGGCSKQALLDALLSDSDEVSQEAAVSLGELRVVAVRPWLADLLENCLDPAFCHRVAIAAGRVGMSQAQNLLIAALASQDPTIRYRAAHYLGRIGNANAVSALMRASKDSRSAHFVAFALGRVGRRAGGATAAKVGRFLVSWLGRTHDALVRSFILRGMGVLALPDLVGAIRPWLGRKALPEAAEALVRCGGVGRPAGAATVFGRDFVSGAPIEGLLGCRRKPDAQGFAFLHLTTCRVGAQFSVAFDGPLPGVVTRSGSRWRLSLRVKPDGAAVGGFLHVTVSGVALPKRRLRPGWQDLTWQLSVVCGAKTIISAQAPGPLVVDHVLLWEAAAKVHRTPTR